MGLIHEFNPTESDGSQKWRFWTKADVPSLTFGVKRVIKPRHAVGRKKNIKFVPTKVVIFLITFASLFIPISWLERLIT